MEYSEFAAEKTPFPATLLPLPQWLLWRGQEERTRQGTPHLTTIPITPQTLRVASTTDPRTWASSLSGVETLPAALAAGQADNPDSSRGGGLGFVFTAHDPYVGIDLDHVIDPTGTMQPWALPLVQAFHPYPEVSPSATGLPLLGRGTVGRGHKRGPIEGYDRARFFTRTGPPLDGSPPTLAAIQEPLAWLLPSMESVAKALDRHGERFSSLFAGQGQRTYPSQPEGDLALCRLAVQAGATAEQCEALVRLSGLSRPKWDERHGSQTYGQLTIATALQGHRAPSKGPSRHRNGTPPEREAASRWPYRELPETAAVDDDLAQGACLWLEN